MERFTELYLRLDQSTRTNEKVEALKDYFRAAPARDAAWALYLFTGRKMGRTVSSTQLKTWAAEVTGYPMWLVEECNHLAGDLSETLSLLLPPPTGDVRPEGLAEVIEGHLQMLGHMPAAKQAATMRALWARLNAAQRFVLHKLVSGSFRVGVSEQLVIRALAEVAEVDAAIMAHRLAGKWVSSEAVMRRFLAGPVEGEEVSPSMPYPFMLAHVLAEPLESLGEMGEWLVECKWDGIRAQVIRRGGGAYLWSRGDQSVAGAFPDLLRAAGDLPEGTVLDGEIVAWREGESGEGSPLPFAQLQRRLNRKGVEMGFWPEVPIVYMAFDVLEFGGKDVRGEALAERRRMLAASLKGADEGGILRASEPLACATWESVREWLRAAREVGVEGVMIKRMDSAYVPGRPTGAWWKLKVQPFSVDAVLIAAQPGRGRRAGLLTDYTFGVWDAGKLVPVAKAYSGLTDAELVEMDRYIRQHSTDRYGPVYAVPGERVFELGFEAIQRSDRHKSGVALRFPRILRVRTDKRAEEADTLGLLRELLEKREKLSG